MGENVNKKQAESIEKEKKECECDVTSHWMNLKYVENQTLELCKKAVNRFPGAIRFAKFQDEEMALKVVKANGKFLKYVQHQTEEICWVALEENCYSFEFVKEPTDEMIEYALRREGSLINYIKNPTREMYRIALTYGADYNILERIEQTELACEVAIEVKPFYIRDIVNPSEELCLKAIKNNWAVIRVIKNPTPEMCMLTYEQDKDAAEYFNF